MPPTAPTPPIERTPPTGRTPASRRNSAADRGPAARESDRDGPRLAIRAHEPVSASVEEAGARLQNPRQLSDRIAMGRALWRDLVVGFAGQLGELGLGFTQLAALYAVAGTITLTVGDLAEQLGRSPSAASRIVAGLVDRGLLVRREEVADKRLRILEISEAGTQLLGQVDRARAEQFLAVVRQLPESERALVAMGVAALAEHGISRRGKLLKAQVG
jgi:DNA-binding MarR family transcriptional regulator